MQDSDAQTPAREAQTEASRRKLPMAVQGAESGTAAVGRTKAAGLREMEAVVERGNLMAAYGRVMSNKGAPGVDGVTVNNFMPWLKENWPSVKAALLAGDYMPQAVRAVEIPKANGGVRQLGMR